MKMYSWDEIKAAGDCVDFMRRELGMQSLPHQSGEWTRFNCPYRAGSDSESFTVKKDCFYDHKEKRGGSIIDLAMATKTNGDLWRAQEYLGELYGLKPFQETKAARKFICSYDYIDLSGNLIHSTVRWEPKRFSQRRPNPDKPGEWIWNLDGIETILYRLKEWHNKRWVILAEGEKDCDNLAALGLPATTNPQGAEKWCDTYTQYFRDKHVVIFPDNDDTGRAHAQLVAWNIRLITKDIKIVQLPGLPPKGDVSDWLEQGGTKEKLLDLIKAAAPADKNKLADPNVKNEASIAKRANEKPFQNFRWVEKGSPDGKSKDIREPIHINELISEVHRRFWNFPRKVGSFLFDHDRTTGEIRAIPDSRTLCAWIAEKSGHQVNWAKIEGAVTQEQLFPSLDFNCQKYNLISEVPSWPARTDVYYTHGLLPEPTSDARYFNELSSFFNPDTPEDATLLRVMFASPLYFRPKIDRPIWVIDSTTGQESGKTKLVEMLSYLYGGDGESGSPIWVDYKQINGENNYGTILKRLLSSDGRKKHIFLLDNVVGYFKCSALATLATQGEITGMAPYGHGEETRPNDLTYVITVNSASLDRDLISRSFFINIKRPDIVVKEWERNIIRYIQAHRLQIIADIIGILERGPTFSFTPATRFKTWESEIMAPIIGNKDQYEQVFKRNMERKTDADGELHEAEDIRALIRNKLEDAALNPNKCDCWFPVKVMADIAREAVSDWQKIGERTIMHFLRNLIKGGMIPEMQLKPDICRYDNKTIRGLHWCTDPGQDEFEKPILMKIYDGKLNY
jgi:hypothetical protein